MCFLQWAGGNYLECRSLLLLEDSKLSDSRKQKQDDSRRPAFSIGGDSAFETESAFS
jgi:hypothetical protein